ncbi:MAG TPA: methyltransferase domain-containing protein [Actinomycetota bacterium]|nr:methyltransferase domain-containing protein [Actinomycetota bacterium]
MSLKRTQRTWDALGSEDAMWAILTVPGKRGGKWDAEEFFAWGRDEIRALLDDLDALGVGIGRRHALDFGCGIGRLTRALADHFEEVDGVDIAPSMIRLAEELNSDVKGCRFHLNATADLGLFPDDRFDLVYSNITLQHIEPSFIRSYLGEFVRVARPGGAVVFQLPTGRAAPREETGGTLKRTLRRAAPARTLGWYRTARRALPTKRHVIEMHALPEAEVRALLDVHGARLVEARPDSWATGWRGLRYFAVVTAR